MDKKSKICREFLRSKSPKAVKEFLLSLELPENELRCVLMHDVEQKDLCFIADTLGMCERRAAELHRIALRKIVDTVEHL